MLIDDILRDATPDDLPLWAKNSQGAIVGLKARNGGVASWVQKRLTNTIGMKPTGTVATTGSAAGRTWSLKMAAPGDFVAARLVVYHHDNVATTAYRAIMAATEEERNDTATQIYRPLAGGVEYSGLDLVESFGWKSVTWNGAADITSAAAAASNAPVINVSDWLPLSSVARRDGSPFPFILVRMSVLGGTSAFTGDSALMETVTASNGGFVVQSRFVADGTGVMVTAPATNHPSGGSASTPTIGVQFLMRKKGISLMGIGDSLLANQSVSPDKFSSIGWRAAAALSAAGIPCGYVNNGQPANTMQAYTTAGLNAMNAWTPNAVMLQSFSPNNLTSNTDAKTRAERQRMDGLLMQLINRAGTIGATPFVTTAIPSQHIVNTTQESERIAGNLWRRALSEEGTTILDWDALVTNGGNPAAIAAAYAYDATHPNEAALNLQALQLAAALRTTFNL